MNRETVLVIEDNRDMRAFLRNAVLEPDGYQVLLAHDGKAGLEHILEDVPDLILMDLHLPRISGLELMSLLHQKGYQIPTIVISAYGSEDSILQAFRLGAKDFLQKPFATDEARDAIENALMEERLRREKENLTKALALANRRLQQQVQHWMSLHDLAQAITSTLDEPEIFRRVMGNVNKILQVEAGSLLLLESDKEELQFAVTLQGDAVQFSDFSIKVGQGIAGWVAQHGEPLLVPDVENDPRFYKKVDHATGFQSRSILCVPLKAKEHTIGVLEVINKLSGPESPSFTQGDMELLKMMASWVSVAVENARLNRAARKAAATQALKQTVTTLAHYINNRLMSFSLEMDSLESDGLLDPDAINSLLDSARQCIREVSAVVSALDRLGEIRTVPYVGAERMIDIEEPLKEQLRRLEERR